MRGGSSETSTLYLRFMRSTVISTWRLPTPEISSCFVSGSKWWWTVGSSSAMRASAREILSSSPRLLGWMAKLIAGSGNDLGQLERMRLVGQRVAHLRLLELLGDADLAGPEGLHVLLRLALQPRDVPHALLGPTPGVQQRGVGAQRAGVHAEERQLADMRIGQRLEDERADRRLGVGPARAGLLGLEVGAADLAAIQGRRELVHDQVEQRLAADALGGRRAQDRHDLALADAGPQRLEHLRLGQRALLEVLGQQVVVGLGRRLHQLLAPLLHTLGRLGGDVGVGRLAVAVERRALGDQIDEAAEAA